MERKIQLNISFSRLKILERKVKKLVTRFSVFFLLIVDKKKTINTLIQIYNNVDIHKITVKI